MHPPAAAQTVEGATLEDGEDDARGASVGEDHPKYVQFGGRLQPGF